MKYRIAIIAFITFLASSCGISSVGSDGNRNDLFKVGKSTTISNYEVIQTLGKDFGLAYNRHNLMIVAVKSTTKFSPIYDGEIINGRVVMIDTYTYETREDKLGRTTVKTVPLVVPYSE